MHEADFPAEADVVLATYNGEEFLAEQLETILGQRGCVHTRLLVGDDGSIDRTPGILEDFAQRFPGRLMLLPNPLRLGTSANFNRLLQASTAPYVFLCDQDDRWHADKVERSLRALRRLEARWGPEHPLLLFTDLRVVDRSGRRIADSFWKYQRIDASRCLWKDLLLQNVVTGCTVAVNRPLLSRALPVPGSGFVHDAWLGLVAAVFGQIVALPEVTVDYRQHGRNQIGARAWTVGHILRRAVALLNRSNRSKRLGQVADQAQALRTRFRDLPPEVWGLLTEVTNLPARSGWSRLALALRHGLVPPGCLRQMGWLLLLASAPRWRSHEDDAKLQQCGITSRGQVRDTESRSTPRG